MNFFIEHVEVNTNGQDPAEFWGDSKQGTNGMILALDGQGTTLLVGAGMPGMLVAAALEVHGSGQPATFGYRDAAGWGMGGVYDIDSFQPSSQVPHSVQALPPLAVVVSPHKKGTTTALGVIQMQDPTTNAFLPTAQWKQVRNAIID